MKTVGFYVKAGIETGYGHIVRCLALADELKRRGAECVFATNELGMQRVVAGKHVGLIGKVPIISSGGEIEVQARLPDGSMDVFIPKMPKFDVWIIDLEDGTPLSIAQYFRPLCKKLVILNGVGYPDGDPGRLLADLVFYQGVTDRPYQLDWTDFRGQWFTGPEYLILRDQFRRLPRREPHDKPRIVIAGGGSDPKGVTAKAVDALADYDWDLRVIVGPANKLFAFSEATIIKATLGDVEVVQDPPSMVEALAWADVAVVSYGMTAFECLALGIPTVALSISPDHKASADLVMQQGKCALSSLGLVEDTKPESIARAVHYQLAAQAQLSKQAREFVDGRGAGRVAELVLE